MILKERNREMCGVQTFLSLVLFNSHVQKKVCQPVSECIRVLCVCVCVCVFVCVCLCVSDVCVCVSNILYM